MYSTFNEILLEYDKIEGEGKYKEAIKEEGFKVNDSNRVKFYYGLYYLFTLSPIDALKVVQDTGIKQKTKEKVKRKLDDLIFEGNFEKIKSETKKEKTTFEDLIIEIETYFKINVEIDITAAKYLAYKARIKKIEQKKEWQRNSKT